MASSFEKGNNSVLKFIFTLSWNKTKQRISTCSLLLEDQLRAFEKPLDNQVDFEIFE